MKARNTISEGSASQDRHISTEAHVEKSCPLSASHPAITRPYDAQPDPSTRGQVSQLVLAMAALRLEKKKTEELIQNKYEILDPSSAAKESHYVATLDDEYVFVDK
jgi:hypothetical protein